MQSDKSYRGGTGTPPKVGAATGREPRLLEQVRARIRAKHYSIRTEQAYLQWIRRYILANGKRHPRELDGASVETFLTRLATRDTLSPVPEAKAINYENFSPLLSGEGGPLCGG